MIEARQHRCEEASPLSQETYVPCNQPAEQNVFHARDNRTYRMCMPCADHNIRNRGAEDRGPYNKE